MKTETPSPQKKAGAARAVSRHRRAFTPKQRGALVRKYRRAGLTQREFCARHGIHTTTLGNWLRNAKDPAPSFAEVSVAVNVPAPIEVELPCGIRIHVRTCGDIAKTAELIRGVACPAKGEDSRC